MLLYKIKQLLKKNNSLYKVCRHLYLKLFSYLYIEILWLLPRATAHKIKYFDLFGRKLDLKNPRDLNQKLHYLVVYRYTVNEGRLVHKQHAKDYVISRCIPDLYVAKLLKVYKKLNHIDISELPDQFVLKVTNGSGDAQICSEKGLFDLDKAKKNISRVFNRHFAKLGLEYCSYPIKQAILAEEYLPHDENDNLIDYKVCCIHGKVKAIMVWSGEQVLKTKCTCFDPEWNHLDWIEDGFVTEMYREKPANLKRMIEIAEELARPFIFARIDLFNINEKIYFGEFTFAPFGGMVLFLKQEALNILGDMLDVKK